MLRTDQVPNPLIHKPSDDVEDALQAAIRANPRSGGPVDVANACKFRVEEGVYEQ